MNLLELWVGRILQKLENQHFTSGQEDTTLLHPGQCHQPVHLATEDRAAGERARVYAVPHLCCIVILSTGTFLLSR